VATAALLGVIVACVANVVVELDDVGTVAVPDEDGNLVVAAPVPDEADEAPDKEVTVVVVYTEAPEEALLALADAVPLDFGPDDTPDGGVVEVPVGYVREEGMVVLDVADGLGDDENDPVIPSSAKLGE